MNIVITIVYIIRILYDWQLIKAYRDFMTFCMTFASHFMPLMMKLMVQHTGDTFPTLTNLDYLTNHISLKLSSFLQIERSVFITTGILTRVDYLRIKELKLP